MEWGADSRLGVAPRRFRTGSSSGKVRAHRHYARDVRLLFHRLLAGHSSQRRCGRESHSDHGLSGEPRHGVSERLGSIELFISPGPRYCTAAASARRFDESRGVGRGDEDFRREVQDRHGRARPGERCVLKHRPDLHRRTRVARHTLEVRHGRAALRFQHAPVHGHEPCRLQAKPRLRRAAVHLRGLRVERHDDFHRRKSVYRAPDHVAASATEQK